MDKTAVVLPEYIVLAATLLHVRPELALCCQTYVRLFPDALTANVVLVLPQVLTLTGFKRIPGFVLIVIIELPVLVVVTPASVRETVIVAENEPVVVSAAFIV